MLHGICYTCAECFILSVYNIHFYQLCGCGQSTVSMLLKWCIFIAEDAAIEIAASRIFSSIAY